MLTVLSVLALLLVAVTMGLSLAHALELPGKLRLDEPTYRAVQTIYYPGFTIGGLIGEVGGMLALATTLLILPSDHERFWWIAVALVLQIAAHATYWLVTHPVNSAWLKNTQLTASYRVFFKVFAASEADWKHMRDIWEWSHVARAGLATLAFLSIAIAVVL